MSKGGGYTSCRFLVVKNTLNFSKHLRPKRSLPARLGISKLVAIGEPRKTKENLRKPWENLIKSMLFSWDSTVSQAQRPGRSRIVSQGWSALIKNLPNDIIFSKRGNGQR